MVSNTDQTTAPIDRDGVRRIYFRLEALWHSLEPHESGTITDGPAKLFITSTEELHTLTYTDYSAFMPDVQRSDDDKVTCSFVDLKIQVSALLGELRHEYVPESMPHFIKVTESDVPNINIQQNVEQNVSFSQTLIHIAGRLEQVGNTTEIGTKKRTFIDTLKTVLHQANDYASLLALMVSTANTIDLPMSELLEILQSLGLA